MIKSCNTTHSSERDMKPARLNSCQECPFRKENRHREHPGGVYSDGEFSKIWRGVSQDGTLFGCHMFDADLHPFNEESEKAGYKKPADVGGRIECAGMVAMVERELDRADSAPSYEEYNRERPLGMSKKAVMVYSARRNGERGPELRTSTHKNLDDYLDPHDVVDPEHVKWQFSEEQADALLHSLEAIIPSIRKCSCVICEHHTDVHAALPLTTAENLLVEVDAELHPFLAALAAAGIRTTDSCINMHECIMTVAPESYGTIVNSSDRRTMNYETIVRRKVAFIRLRNENDQEQAFIATAAELPGVETMTSGRLTQIVFPAETIPALLESSTA